MTFNYYKNKFFINIGAILLFFILITFFIIYPSLSKINKVNKEITEERIKLEKKLALGLNIKKITQDLEKIEEPAKQLDNIFIKKGQELELVNQLELIASDNNINLELTSDFSGQDIELNISQVEIKMVLTGEYKKILNFMSDLENSENYFNLKSIAISQNKKDSGLVIAQLTGNAFFKK